MTTRIEPSTHGRMFSLEGPEGLRFLTRSRLYTEEESAQLAPAGRR